jgi:hypothetical protein
MSLCNANPESSTGRERFSGLSVFASVSRWLSLRFAPVKTFFAVNQKERQTFDRKKSTAKPTK